MDPGEPIAPCAGMGCVTRTQPVEGRGDAATPEPPRLREPTPPTRTDGSGPPSISSGRIRRRSHARLLPRYPGPSRSAETRQPPHSPHRGTRGSQPRSPSTSEASHERTARLPVAVVDARRWQLARGRVPDHVGIEVLTPRLAIACLESAHDVLDDLHVLLRHCPFSIPARDSYLSLEGIGFRCEPSGSNGCS
jgi:hypothetical protein